ncbi:Mg(2+) transporter [Myotisia sp. PD_48]|nr:Mg(2+) transporter [Myotisia sp. PD_48]
MTDTPRSDRCQTRYSTPVPELDDHRFQAEALPRPEASDSRYVLNQPARPEGLDQPDLLQINEALQTGTPRCRDFEHAIIDDNDNNSIGELERMGIRRLSATPMAARTSTHRHRQEHPNRSRSSSTSSNSSSPPNSVEAFAEPRRRERANTIDSHQPVELDLPLHRTVSASSHHRRPTFSNASAVRPDSMDPRVNPTEEADVCFPPYEEQGRTSFIDYEELEEFVALKKKNDPTGAPLGRKQSLSSQTQYPRVFGDLRPDNVKDNIPKIMMTPAGSNGMKSDSSERIEEVLKQSDLDSINEKRALEAPQNATELNRFSFFSSELDSTVHASELGDLILPGDTFRDLFQLGPEGGVWWLDVMNPTNEEIGVISRAFSIHPLTAEDIMTQEAREKVELFRQYYFVCFRTFYQTDKSSENYLEPVNLYMVVFREGVISFSFVENPHAANVRKRIGKLREYVSLSSDWICYAMIDDIVDSFGPVIRDVETESEAIEDHVYVARLEDFNAFLPQIGGLRKKVMSLMRLLGGKADVIKGFAKRCNEQYSVTPRGDIGLYLGDIQDHVVTMMSSLGHFEKMLSRSHSNYLAQINVTHIMLGNHVNKVLSKITFLASILVPMNLICGLFGMNVPVPGQGGDLGWFFARFAASLAATILVVVLYLVLSSPKLAYAVDVDSIVLDKYGPPVIPPPDLENHIFLVDPANDEGKTGEVEVPLWERVGPEFEQLSNNVGKPRNIEIGETQYWIFPKKEVNGPKSPTVSGTPVVNGRDAPANNEDNKEASEFPSPLGRREEELARRSTIVYITVNTCLQPGLNATREAKDSSPPHLWMYVSRSSKIEKPGPAHENNPDVTSVELVGGYAIAEIEAEGDITISVRAPNSTRYRGIYNYEVAASIDAPFHRYENGSSLLNFVDGDSRAALLQTNHTRLRDPGDPIYGNWEKTDQPPFVMFAHDMHDPAILGLHKSYCGLYNNALISRKLKNVEVSMTSRIDNELKEQFYVKELNRSSTYYGFLAIEGNSTAKGEGVVGGGGKVWKSMTFTTKSENNCAVIYNLDFCSEVAYAVPSHPQLNTTELINIYDKHAEKLYKNFTYSLQQIQCNTSDTDKYSIAKSCKDCATKYKNWLCAVTIPRCQDFTSDLPFLQPRNLGQAFIDVNREPLPDNYEGKQNVFSNSSRNYIIDTEIKPGPYKEVLPCLDLCHELVQACPAALGFGCPVDPWKNHSYGLRNPNKRNMTCSFLGATYISDHTSGFGAEMKSINSNFFALVVLWTFIWGVVL